MSNQYLTNINVDKINADERTALERLLGHPLDAGQQVFISSYSPGIEPPPAQKASAAKVIESVTKKAQENVDKQHLADSDVEDAIQEAISHARKRK
ncbi:MAG TPA: hypothetical protein PKD64_15405 [Pirellulaceae bacterium]|nr:hypothetical protein [Pirellulaceae bacterium]HMO93572.1 hypothetical protein [Pirellulaceae bacterium]HMP71585.1 hypothetical protein [Pirellulaceae bacterium]